MRIGIVSVSYLPRLGGAVTQTLLLHKYLQSRGHQVEVFCPDLGKAGRFDEQGIVVNRVHNRFIRSFDGSLARIAIILELRKAIQQRHKDFDAFITPEFNIGPLSLSLTRGTRKIGIYGADLTFEFINLKRDEIVSYEHVLAGSLAKLGPVNCFLVAVLNALQNFIFHRLDWVIALNPADLERIRKRTGRVVKIGCLLDAAGISEGCRQKPKALPQMITIIGRAVSWKQIPDSIRAALRIRQVYPGIEIHYFGTGPQLPQIEAEFGKSITIHKDLQNRQVLEWLANSDITINLSDYETFCITNAEAMLSRSLLLAKPLREYQDYLFDQQNCMLISDFESQDWITRLQQAFQSGEVKRLLDGAQTTIRKLYDVQTTGAQIEELLRKTAGE